MDYSVKVPDFAASALAGYEAGQKLGKQRRVQSALSGYSTNPDASIASLIQAGDVTSAKALSALRRDQQEQEALTKVWHKRTPTKGTTLGDWMRAQDNQASLVDDGYADAPASALSAMPTSTAPIDPNSVDHSTWDKRGDGSDKGNGFLGLMKRPDGTVSSELSIGVPINGKETDIPTMVPGLTHDELTYLLNTPPERLQQGPQFESIRQKAVAHAQQRVAQGLSPFAGPNDGPKSSLQSALSGSQDRPPAPAALGRASPSVSALSGMSPPAPQPNIGLTGEPMRAVSASDAEDEPEADDGSGMDLPDLDEEQLYRLSTVNPKLATQLAQFDTTARKAAWGRIEQAVDMEGRIIAGIRALDPDKRDAAYQKIRADMMSRGVKDLPESWDESVAVARERMGLKLVEAVRAGQADRRIDNDIADDEADNERGDRDLEDRMTDRRERRGIIVRGQNISSSDRRRGQDVTSQDRQRGQDQSSEDRRRGQDLGGRRGPRGGGSASPAVAVGATATDPKTNKKVRWTGKAWEPVR